jgi:phage shock protein A
MGIFSRLTDVVNSNIHAMLDKAEDPEKMVRLIIQEMEDTMVEVRSTAVRSLARRKELLRAIEQLQADAADWAAKAELAVSKNRDDLARGALAARERALEALARLEKEQKLVDEDISKLEADISKLQAQLLDARRRQKTIIARQHSVSSRLKVKQQLDERKTLDAMFKMQQYETRIDRMEAEVESYDLGARSLDEEFAAMDADERVEAELEKLRARHRKNAGGQPSDNP